MNVDFLLNDGVVKRGDFVCLSGGWLIFFEMREGITHPKSDLDGISLFVKSKSAAQDHGKRTIEYYLSFFAGRFGLKVRKLRKGMWQFYKPRKGSQ